MLRAISVARSMSLPAPVVLLIQNQLFGDSAAHEERDIVLRLHRDPDSFDLRSEGVSHPKSHPSRNDRHFVNRIRAWHELADQRMAGFVISGRALLASLNDHALALDAHDDFVFSCFEIAELQDTSCSYVPPRAQPR